MYTDDILLQEDDPEWYLFYGSWSLEKLAVNKDGEVVLTDLAGMAIVDKNLFRGNIVSKPDVQQEGRT